MARVLTAAAMAGLFACSLPATSGAQELTASVFSDLAKSLKGFRTSAPESAPSSIKPREIPQEFPKTKVTYAAAFLPKTASVSQLMTSGGDVYLFRVIDQKYIPGFVGPFAKEEGAISYSLNPYIAVMWDSKHTRNKNSTLLIARNSVHSDELLYPDLTDYVGAKYKGRLKPNTQLREIRYLDEVKVPIPRENVLRAIPLGEFQRIADGFGPAPFGLDELLAAVLAPR